MAVSIGLNLSNNNTNNANKIKQIIDESGIQLPENYQAKTDDERRRIAELLYKNQLDSANLSAQQAYDANAAAINAQRAGINTSYDRQLEQQREANAKSIAAQDRAMLSRGMQRSSYNAATQANMRLKGDEALGDIEQNRTNALGSLDAQLTQLQQQLQQNKTAAQSAYETNVLNKINELENTDYTRNNETMNNRNNVILQLLQLTKDGSGSWGSGGGGYSGGGVSDDGAAYNPTGTTPDVSNVPAPNRDYGGLGGGIKPNLPTLNTSATTANQQANIVKNGGGSNDTANNIKKLIYQRD